MRSSSDDGSLHARFAPRVVDRLDVDVGLEFDDGILVLSMLEGTKVADHLDRVASHVDGGARDVVPRDGDGLDHDA